MTTEGREATLTIATSVARRYARRVWWADFGDMRQEAALAIMIASRTFDPLVGVPWRAYADRAAVLALRTWLWRQSAPVGTRSNSDLRGKLAGLLHVPLTEATHVEDPAEPVDAQVHRAVMRIKVRTALQDMGVAEPLVGEMMAAATKTGGRVQRHVRRAMRRVGNDLGMWELWRDL